MNLEDISQLIRDWTVNTRLPEIQQEILRRIYYKQLIEQSDKAIADEMARCKTDPVHWFNNWVWTYDPRGLSYNLPPNIPFVLRPRQADMVEWLQERIFTQTHGLIEKSRDEGMSYVILGFFLHQWLFVDGFAAGVGSRKEDLVDKKGDPKTLFYKFRDMLNKLPDWMKPKGYNEHEHDNYMRIINPANGATLTGEAGDNIGRGGRTSIYLLDEWAFVERAESIDAAISQNTNVHIKGSTPNGIGNRFYQDRFSGRYNIFSMAWQENPDKNWQVPYQGKLIHPWYEKQKLSLDSVTLAQEVDVDYAASVEGVVLPTAWINSIIDAHKKLAIEVSGQRLLSLDVADEGRDQNAIASRYGILLDYIHAWSGVDSDIFATSQKAVDTCNDFGIYEFLYDADGLGAGVRGDTRVINEMRPAQKDVEAIAFRGSAGVHDPDGEMVEGKKNVNNFEKLKAQAWWSLRQRVLTTHRAVTEGMPYNPSDIISIDSNIADLALLKVELSQPTYSKSKSGKIVINKTPPGTKSPNMADSVMMVFADHLIEKPTKSFRATAGQRTF